jgi:glycosyltransferase involved in cell wall biosynthesis
MAGKSWSKEMREFCAAAHLQDCAIEMTNVPDQTLMALSTGAKALFFPSREEGFGWPVIEAQACG